MAKEESLTKSDLIAAIKEIGLATKDDIKDIVHNEITEFYVGMIKPEFHKVERRFDQLETETKKGFKRVNKRIDKLEADIHFIKDDINGLKGELASTPSRREVDELKARIDKYHPLS